MSEVAPTKQISVEQHVLDRVRAVLDEEDLLTIHASQFEFTYTVGLTDALLPELAVTDVAESATAWLNALATRCADGELEIGVAMQLTDEDGGEHALMLVRHDPAVHPDPTLSRCLYGDRLDVRLIDLRSCSCARCLGCDSERGYLGDLVAAGWNRLR